MKKTFKGRKKAAEHSHTEESPLELMNRYRSDLQAIQHTLKIVSGKWKTPIIGILSKQSFRYSELANGLSDILPQELTNELTQLEEAGIIEKQRRETDPEKAFYKLSDHGFSLMPLMNELTKWGKTNQKRIKPLKKQTPEGQLSSESIKFEHFKLAPAILRALKEEQYIEPTAIQAKSIPLILEKRDVLANAQTGTGKTAAFALPIVQFLSDEQPSYLGDKSISALIVTPTRELAIQIGESITAYAKYTQVSNTVIFGGVSQARQIEALSNGLDILVATPGRLLDLINQGYVSLNKVKYFVLDEADRMLDMGFIHDIRKILTKLPKEKQSLFFSATMPEKIQKLSQQILNNPKKVAVNPVSSTAETIQQYLYMTNRKSKNDLLLHILKNPELDQVLLFSRTKRGADRIARNLHKKKIKCAAIHGDKSQNQRQKALKEFKEGKIRVLVATDIAARGIDIEKLQYVINYNIPNESETYVHRIGRCGRAGETGISISLCESEENAYIKDIEKLIRKKIEIVTDNPYPQTDKPMNFEEKKAFEKEKQRRRAEFFANRKKKRSK